MNPNQEATLEDSVVEHLIHADLYEQDIDAAADGYEASKRRRRTVIVTDDNPWE